MKTFRKIFIAALFACAALCPSESKGQISLDSYYNIDWQFNIPVGNDFSNGASGWGMNFEGGYYVTQNIAVGVILLILVFLGIFSSFCLVLCSETKITLGDFFPNFALKLLRKIFIV